MIHELTLARIYEVTAELGLLAFGVSTDNATVERQVEILHGIVRRRVARDLQICGGVDLSRLKEVTAELEALGERGRG